MTIKMTLIIALTIAVLGVSGPGASAKILPTKTCLKARAERDALALRGYATYLDEGPQALRSKMTPTVLIGVKRLIYLTEIVEFRCDKLKMEAVLKRLNSPQYRRWQALNPPLPQRNPRFVGVKRR